MYINDHDSNSPKGLKLYRYEYYIPMSVIVALMFDNCFGTARFLCVKHKASSNAFSYIDPHPYSPAHRRGIGIRTGQSYEIIMKQQRKFRKNLENSKKVLVEGNDF